MALRHTYLSSDQKQLAVGVPESSSEKSLPFSSQAGEGDSDRHIRA